MTPSIEILFKDISQEILHEFESKIDKSIEVKIQAITEDLEQPAEITIDFNEPITEIIVGSESSHAIEDGLKALWKRVKREQSIELNFRLKLERTIEFDLNGNVDPNQIDEITEKVVHYLRNLEQQKKDFENPDFKAQDDVKPRLRVRYNPITDQLEVVNYSIVRKQMEEAFKRLAGKFKS